MSEPERAPGLSPYDVEHLRDALARDPRVGELDVHITTGGGRVFITGNVVTLERREAITVVAAEVLPEYEICNQTSVASFPEPEESEELT